LAKQKSAKLGINLEIVSFSIGITFYDRNFS